MVIRKILKIRDFGIFKRLDWDPVLSNFSDVNLLYGWNYCGKTTLSRILRCFELGRKHPDYSSAKFEFEDEDGKLYTDADFPKRFLIRVFNTDFICDNLKWDEGIEPIFMLGELNIELQNELEAEKEKKKTIQEELGRLQENEREIKKTMHWALSNKASEIKNTLTLTVFDKRHFEASVHNHCDDETSSLLANDEVQKLVNTYKSTERKAPLNSIQVDLIDISFLHKECNQLLSKIVTAKIIERLRKDSSLNEWVKKGKELHYQKSNCEFCGNALPDDLLDNLSLHFSKDYDVFLGKLNDKSNEIEGHKIRLLTPDSASLYSELQSDYQFIKSQLETEIQKFNETLDVIIRKLSAKKTNVFTKLEVGGIINNKNRILSLISDINNLIKLHNKKTNEFEIQKKAAYEKLIMNYALEFVRVQNYREILAQDTSISEQIDDLKRRVVDVDSKMLLIEEKLSETVKGAEKINAHLRRYFGKDDIVIRVTADNKFQLLRNGHTAKNLSEGEKTAIAFAYFISKLEDKNTTLTETIIYIDDPISSLDSNHLFNTYSFIRMMFFDEQSKSLKCRQLFISTHNFEFFNLVKDWLVKLKKKNKSFYLIERMTNDTIDESKILQLPPLLLKFKSEYCFLFSIIYRFRDTPGKDFEQLYNLPNILRRFLETFTAFKYLSTRNVDENLEHLVTDTYQCERVRKFVHYHSHSLSTNRIMQFSDMKECLDIVNIVLQSIETIDKEHYDSLISEIHSVDEAAAIT